MALHDLKTRLKDPVGAVDNAALVRDLKDARLSRKMSQADVALALGISQEMVSMIENGTKALPADLVASIRNFIASGG
ncbi:MAG: Helix-turn-helix domain [Aeromicrobium sp.]|nr:Helix-turn-helix domain [Aeromicrobium sp.]